MGALASSGPPFLLCYNDVCESRSEPPECGGFASFPRSAHVGEWLSLVEHLVRDQGVGGSNPLSPTNYLEGISAVTSPATLVTLSVFSRLCPNLCPPRRSTAANTLSSDG